MDKRDAGMPPGHNRVSQRTGALSALQQPSPSSMWLSVSVYRPPYRSAPLTTDGDGALLLLLSSFFFNVKSFQTGITKVLCNVVYKVRPFSLMPLTYVWWTILRFVAIRRKTFFNFLNSTSYLWFINYFHKTFINSYLCLLILIITWFFYEIF